MLFYLNGYRCLWSVSISLIFACGQLILLNIALLIHAEAGEIIMLLGNDILMVLAGFDLRSYANFMNRGILYSDELKNSQVQLVQLS